MGPEPAVHRRLSPTIIPGEPFYTTSPSFATLQSVHPGLGTAAAVTAEHVRATGGCTEAVDLSKGVTLQLGIAGGKANPSPSGSGATIVTGGHVAYIAVESKSHPVGLTFC